MLIYLAGGNALKNRHLIVVDRQGTVSEWSSERRPIEYDMKASPDGNRAVIQVNNPNAITELWVSERGQPSSRRVGSRPGADCLGHTWSYDGRTIAFSQNANDATDGIYMVEAGGASAPRMIAKKPSPTAYVIPSSWSPDRGTLLASVADSGRVMVWAYLMPAKEGDLATGRNLFNDAAVHAIGVFSPDGRVMAYQSVETGKVEVYACGWAAGGLIGQPIMVSRGGGEIPRWSHDGKHLYYSVQGKLMSVEITSRPALSASPPTLAWNLAALRIPPNSLGSALYDILPDGRLLAVQGSEEEETPTQFNVVLNFDEVVKQRMHAAEK
jgi:Tol biopolymer transport system component